MGTARVTRDEWLDIGLEAFGKSGLSGLKVEAMGRSLGSSKAGFYWYFKSRSAFEKELFEHWRARETKQIIAASQSEGEPVAKLLRLFNDVIQVRRSADFTFHLRRLARRRKSLARLLDETESERIDYLASILVELDKSEAVARDIAEAIYHLYLGWYERNQFDRTTPEEIHKLLGIVSSLAGVELLQTGEAHP